MNISNFNSRKSLKYGVTSNIDVTWSQLRRASLNKLTINTWREFGGSWTDETLFSARFLSVLSPTELLTHYLRVSPCSAPRLRERVTMETSHQSHSFISRRWNPTTSLDTNGNSRESRRDKECAKTDYIVMDLHSPNETSQNSSTEWGNVCSGSSYALPRGEWEWHALRNLNIWQYACKICQICQEKAVKRNCCCQMWKMNNFFSIS